MGEILFINKSGFGGQEKWGHFFSSMIRTPAGGSNGAESEAYGNKCWLMKSGPHDGYPG